MPASVGTSLPLALTSCHSLLPTSPTLHPDYFGLKRGEVSARVDAAFSPTGFTPVSDNEHIIYLNPELQVGVGVFTG